MNDHNRPSNEYDERYDPSRLVHLLKQYAGIMALDNDYMSQLHFLAGKAVDEIGLYRGLLWFAWSEFNAIRARDGAPDGVSHDYWDQVTEAMLNALGDDAKPWASDDAKRTLTEP